MNQDNPAVPLASAPAEATPIPNGKSHEPGEEITASANGEKYVFLLIYEFVENKQLILLFIIADNDIFRKFEKNALNSSDIAIGRYMR